MKKIFPKVLLYSKKYSIKGSYRRKIPYITDIDVVNILYPNCDIDYIYQRLIDIINNVDENIIITAITCGVDNRFRLDNYDQEKIDEIYLLLDKNDQDKINNIRNEYIDNHDKIVFYVNEIIWKYYKLRWSTDEILNNNKELSNNINVTFKDILQKNSYLLVQYYIKVNNYYIGIDVVGLYNKIDLTTAYNNAAAYQAKLANYAREYYFMLWPMKYYFRDNKEVRDKLEDIIECKYGLFKQTLVQITSFNELLENKKMTIGVAKTFVKNILENTKNLKNFKSHVIYKIKKIKISDNTIPELNLLLKDLYMEINNCVNNQCKSIFFEFLKLIPEEDRSKFYF